MTAKKFDIAVVGHFSMDSIKLPSSPRPYSVLGGAVAFVSLVAKHLGAEAAVVSRVGADFPNSYLQQLLDADVDVSGVVKGCAVSERTTSFELTYSDDLSSRALRLKQQGLPIQPSDLPKTLSAKVIHIAPIAAEIPFEVVKRLRCCCDMLSIDPQGMTRQFGPDGAVFCCSQIDKRILPMIDVYKSSLDEIQVLTGRKRVKAALKAVHALGPKIVIATLGAQGSVLSVDGEAREVPACKPQCVVDPTGAGDVFIGAFLAEWTRKKVPFWCACMGSAAASLVVEDVGSRFFGSKEEIYCRAEAAYEKEIKQRSIS
jgi:sugar/nucleoside kinase (ribokinase family)